MAPVRRGRARQRQGGQLQQARQAGIDPCQGVRAGPGRRCAGLIAEPRQHGQGQPGYRQAELAQQGPDAVVDSGSLAGGNVGGQQDRRQREVGAKGQPRARRPAGMAARCRARAGRSRRRRPRPAPWPCAMHASAPRGGRDAPIRAGPRHPSRSKAPGMGPPNSAPAAGPR
jgi:hypothetical protein